MVLLISFKKYRYTGLTLRLAAVSKRFRYHIERVIGLWGGGGEAVDHAGAVLVACLDNNLLFTSIVKKSTLFVIINFHSFVFNTIRFIT